MSSKRTHRLTLGVLTLLIGSVSLAHAQFTPIAQPDVAYVAGTTLLPITDPDFTVVSSLTGGGVTVTFDIGLVALTVPTTWSTWGAPPNTESATPRVLWTNGFTSVTLTLSEARVLFGLEAQPNTQVVSPITADFFNGMALVGSITRNVNGNGGALLFAASSTTPFDRIVLSSTDDFAIAQVRIEAVPPTPTPTSTPTATATPTATPTRTATLVAPGGVCASASVCAAGLFCVDGVCCTSACDGPRQRCDFPPQPGTCTDVGAQVPASSPVGLSILAGLLIAVAAVGLWRTRAS